MSHYTTEVRYICENAAGLEKSKGQKSVSEIIAAAIPSVMPDFPIFDENYRTTLCTKILEHYYTREIGFETVGLWKLKLHTKLNEIMPYYNKLYNTELITYNPLYEVDLTREYTKDLDGKETDASTANGSTTDTRTNSGTSLYSDTPQGGLGNFSEDNAYLTNATKNSATMNDASSSTSQVNRNNTIDNTEEYVEHVTGRQSHTPAKLVKEFRDNLLNIDLMIIKDLGELFMTIY